jgi:hypothetical protein
MSVLLDHLGLPQLGGSSFDRDQGARQNFRSKFEPVIKGETDMTANVGTFDRSLRVLAGLALLYIAYYFHGTTIGYLGWVGLIPLATGLLGTCPVYSMIGINTCKVV